MGMDALELVMEVEEAFDISLDDISVEQMETVGQLYEFVLSRTQVARPGKCLTAATFWDVRQAMHCVGVTKRFGPSCRIEDVLPIVDRRKLWSSLSANMNLDLPNLIRPRWISFCSMVLVVLISMILTICTMAFEGGGGALVFLLLMCVFGCLAFYATAPLATNIATEFDTFRGLVIRMLALNAGELSQRHGPMSQSDIWVVLREIVVDTLGVEVDEVTREASFSKDLGCE